MQIHQLLKVHSISPQTPDSAAIHFEKPIGWSYKSGQFLTLIATINGQEVRRAYSLSSCPITENLLSIGIKRVKDGIFSNWILDNATPNFQIDSIEPTGNFAPPAYNGKPRHLVLIGAGSGITPLLSIVKSTLYSEAESQVTLLYGNRTEDSIMFSQTLEELQQKYSHRLRIVHTLTQPSISWKGLKGRISGEMALEVLEHARPVTPISETHYFLCGPQAMMDNVVDSLIQKGTNKSYIHRESFFSGIDEASKIAAQQEAGVANHTVEVIYDGESYKFMVPAEQTILAAAQDLEIDLPYSCQSGLCTACRGKCVSGKVHMDEREGLSDAEMDEGYVLTCVGHPLTEDVIIEIG